MIQLPAISSAIADKLSAAPLASDAASEIKCQAFALVLAAEAPVEELPGNDMPLPGKRLPDVIKPSAVSVETMHERQESKPLSADSHRDDESSVPPDAPERASSPCPMSDMPVPVQLVPEVPTPSAGIAGPGSTDETAAQGRYALPVHRDKRTDHERPAAPVPVRLTGPKPELEQLLTVPAALTARIGAVVREDRPRAATSSHARAQAPNPAVAMTTHPALKSDGERPLPHPAPAVAALPEIRMDLSHAPAHALAHAGPDIAASSSDGAEQPIRPHDFATLVERLAEARETARGGVAELAVNHADFGKVSMSFRHDEGIGLTVGLSASDPEFAQAVSAAMPAERAPSGDNPPHHGRRDADPQAQHGRVAGGGDFAGSGEGQKRGQRDQYEHQFQRHSSRDSAPRAGHHQRTGRGGGIFV